MKVADLVGSISSGRAAKIPQPCGALYVRRWGDAFYAVRVNEHRAFCGSSLIPRSRVASLVREAIDAGETVPVKSIATVWADIEYGDQPLSARDGGRR